MSQRKADYALTEYQFHAMFGKVRQLAVKALDGSYSPVSYDQLQSAIDARDNDKSNVPLVVVRAVPNKGPSCYWVVAATDLEKQLAQISEGERS